MNIFLINDFQKKLGYSFREKELLLIALTHRSAGNNHNERLEFLGDSILNYVISKEIYKKLPSINEGDMSRMRSILVCSNTVADLAKELDLGKFLILGNGELKNLGYNRKSILSGAMEAIIGAILIDSNIKLVEKFITKLYRSRLNDISSLKNQKDPKTKLQEYLQKNHLPLPKYLVAEVFGDAHNKKFTIHCYISCLSYFITGNGCSIQMAEQSAAEKAIKILKLDE